MPGTEPRGHTQPRHPGISSMGESGREMASGDLRGRTADAEKGDGGSRPGLAGRQAVLPERDGGAEIHGGWGSGKGAPLGQQRACEGQ